MSDQKGIFFDEWQACLRAHYRFVIRTADDVTEPTLRGVLRQTGLTDADLDDLRAEALTMPPLEMGVDPAESDAAK